MKILIVYPNIHSMARNEVNIGLCLIAAVLKKAGHQVILFKPDIFSRSTFLYRVKEYRPRLIGFSVTTHQYPYAVKYAELLKQNFDIPIVFGGFHPTLAPEEVISNPNIDIACLGEGEYPLLELADALEQKKEILNIPNLWSKKNGVVSRSEIRPLIENLDSLPFPDREFFVQREILRRNGYRIDVLCGRGCPYNCSYCSLPALRKVNQGKGKFVRLRSVNNVLDEIKYLRRNYKITETHFQDDTFTLDKEWLADFAEVYSSECRIPFHCSTRIECIDEERVKLLRKAGCVSVTFGIETGNEELRKQVLNRHMTNRQIIDVFRLMKEAKIKILALNMVGLPGETLKMIQETIDFNKLLNPDWIGVSIFNPYPQTKLYEECKINGYLKDNIFNDFSPSYIDEKSCILELPTISKKEIIKGYRKFQNFAFAKYIKEKYPLIYPVYCIFRPLLMTPLRPLVIKLAAKLIFDRALLRKTPG